VLRAHVLPHYEQLGEIAFAFAKGSLVEGLAEDADLDVSLAGTLRRQVRLASRVSSPTWTRRR
jgi:hypothetical protein